MSTRSRWVVWTLQLLTRAGRTQLCCWFNRLIILIISQVNKVMSNRYIMCLCVRDCITELLTKLACLYTRVRMRVCGYRYVL